MKGILKKTKQFDTKRWSMRDRQKEWEGELLENGNQRCHDLPANDDDERGDNGRQEDKTSKDS